MDLPIFTPKTTAELLGIPTKSLRSALAQESYSAQDLWALRKALRIHPRPLGHRKQLFLNFKGGTGKTSLSTSYAYRLAELGYSILLVDLDSQGHATKCLGYEGEDFERTLLDVLVRKMPVKEVIQRTPVPNLSFVPSNLSMSTVDLSLMPLAGREMRLRNALKDLDGQYQVTVFDAPPSF